MSVGEFLDRWLKERVKPSTRPRTYESYHHLVEAHIKPALGGLSLKKLHAAQIQAFLNAKLDAGLAGRTVSYIRAVLRAALNHAVKLDLVPRNVATRTAAPKVTEFVAHPLTPEQARTLLAITATHRLHALFLLTLCMGLRQGEALGLGWDDVDLERAQLSVRHTLQHERGPGESFSLAEPKTDRSRRTLALPPLAVEVLKQHRVRQQVERLAVGGAWRNSLNLVFTSEVGTPLDSCNVTHALKRLVKAAGLPDQRFHDLRHATATFLLAQGVSPRVVQEVLGHSDIRLTLGLYSHVLPAVAAEAMTKMDSLLRA